jgi:hypothetical protein
MDSTVKPVVRTMRRQSCDSFPETRVMAVPRFEARPVRPMRCT